MSSSYVKIPVTKCRCGQMGSDDYNKYHILRQTKSHLEAVKILGIQNVCCLTNLLTPTTYPLQRARMGTKSLPPTVVDSGEEAKVFRLEGTRMVKDLDEDETVPEAESTATFSKVNVNSRRLHGVEILKKKEEHEKNLKEDEDYREKDEIHQLISRKRQEACDTKAAREISAIYQSKMSNPSSFSQKPSTSALDIVKANIAKDPTEGLEEELPPDVTISSLRRGMFIPFGWVREENDPNKVLLIDVGEGYRVPVYKLAYITSD
jgi:DNA-directed RNA polymerase subunit N (RpoN/RPB10)